MADMHVSVRRHFTTEFKWELWCDGKIIKDGMEPSAWEARAEREGWLRIYREREKDGRRHQEDD